MRWQLEEIRQGPVSWDETVELEAKTFERPELLRLTPIECAGEVRYAEPDYVFRGRIRYGQELQCTRCLEPTLQDMDIETHYLLVTGDGATADAEELELDSDDLGVVQLEDDELDTEPLVREQIQLNVPMKPLCRDDCAGLCPQCGANLNEGSCSCAREPADPRWAALAGLRSGDSESS